MRAIRLTAPGRDPALDHVPVPIPGPDEVRVAVRSCGLCGSDLKIIAGDTRAAELPLTLGHEAAGIVDEVGAEVRNVAVGDRVVVDPMFGCGACRSCCSGHANRCPQLRVLGLGAPGAHADHTVAPSANVHALPDRIDLRLGAILADAVAGPLHALERSGAARGDAVVVYGLGGLGLHAAMLLDQLTGAHVIGVDTSDAALARAGRFGVAEVFDGRDPRVVERVRAATDGGASAAFEFVGSPPVVEQALRSLAPGGTGVVVGVSSDRLHLGLRQETLVGRELQLIGSLGYRPEHLKRLIELIDSEALSIDGTITHVFPLEGYADALAALRDRSSGAIRVVVDVASESGGSA